MNTASYVSRHTNRRLCHGKHLQCKHWEDSLRSRKSMRRAAPPYATAMRLHHLNPLFMTQIPSRGGRRPKTDPSVNRYVVRFNAEENARFLAMFERSGLESKGAFIKNFIFQKPFKVYTIDENTRVFIDKLSSLNSLFRTLGVSYDNVIKTLRENFTEKKAMSVLYKLEKLTIELIKVNSEIVALAQRFDEQWSLKSR